MWFWIGLLMILFGGLLFWIHVRYFNNAAVTDPRDAASRVWPQWFDRLLFIIAFVLVVAGFVIGYFSSYYPGHIIYLAL
jgi:nucleoside recognition membrane protein YjiH